MNLSHQGHKTGGALASLDAGHPNIACSVVRSGSPAPCDFDAMVYLVITPLLFPLLPLSLLHYND
jgi:hypothetical protein